MKYIFILSILLTGCAGTQYQSPEDYYRRRMSEDSIDWGPNSNNNILDSQDGSTYYNRNVDFIGVKY